MPTVYGRKGFGARAIKNDSGTRPISGGRYVPGSGLRLHSYADRSAKLTVPLRNGFAPCTSLNGNECIKTRFTFTQKLPIADIQKEKQKFHDFLHS